MTAASLTTAGNAVCWSPAAWAKRSQSSFVLPQFHFKNVKYMQHQAEKLSLFNDGQVPCQFEFIQKPNEPTYCKPWLTANPHKGFVAQGGFHVYARRFLGALRKHTAQVHIVWLSSRHRLLLCYVALRDFTLRYISFYILAVLFICLRLQAPLWTSTWRFSWTARRLPISTRARSKSRRSWCSTWSAARTTSFPWRETTCPAASAPPSAPCVRWGSPSRTRRQRSSGSWWAGPFPSMCTTSSLDSALRDLSCFFASRRCVRLDTCGGVLRRLTVVSWWKHWACVDLASCLCSQLQAETPDSATEKQLDIPKELWMMVDHLFRSAVKQVRNCVARCLFLVLSFFSLPLPFWTFKFEQLHTFKNRKVFLRF